MWSILPSILIFCNPLHVLYSYSDVEKIQAGIGDRIAVLVQYTSTFCCGFTVAFVVSWKLAFVVLGVMPLMMTAVGLLTKVCVGGNPLKDTMNKCSNETLVHGPICI